MLETVKFLRDYLIALANLLDEYSFNVSGMNVTILDIFVGFIAMAFVIAVFWKGARA